jgi:hypothetical protein
MNALWTIEGCDWQEQLTAPKDSNPMELATLVIETLIKKSNSALDIPSPPNLGMVIMVSNDKMSSVDETYVCYTPSVLANAGYYTEADNLQKKIDGMLK